MAETSVATPAAGAEPGPEERRLAEDERRERDWKRWGPYLAERQWGTVREDYSAGGDSWGDFSHEQSRSRVYRWGEDGLLGITDRQSRLCFALALWNGQDPILKERLFGLTNPEGNHGEDVKECYYYLDSTPTHSYCKGLYKYPQQAFPYEQLLDENHRRGRDQREFELSDAGVFEGNRYFDVQVEYAKGGPNDVLVRVTVTNRGPFDAPIEVLPTLWIRNTWAWGRTTEGYFPRGSLKATGPGEVQATHASLGSFRFAAAPSGGVTPELVFTENETNTEKLYGVPNASPYVKDAFHELVVHGKQKAVNPAREGTKCAARYPLQVKAGQSVVLRLRLVADAEAPKELFGEGFEQTFRDRAAEADQFHARRAGGLSEGEALVLRQGHAGLLWSKQFYWYDMETWFDGDPASPPPPAGRRNTRNRDWGHLYTRDVLSMPDKWEYPWFAAWDLAFHMLPFADLDPAFAKEQLILLLREWYMHPNGQLPAYEFNFSDVNPPVHAWAAWRVYKISGPKGGRDRTFLARVFNKLLMNFTWWVNRKDAEGRNLFSGGFLGLDNIGVFDRSKPLPTGGSLEQADGTAWMAFYCSTMLSMALELARTDPAYEDLASKFFEHFVAIADAMNELGGTGLWDQEDGFYYDQLTLDGHHMPLKVRSMVGLIPLFAVGILEEHKLGSLPGFKKRLEWFLENRKELARHILYRDSDHNSDLDQDEQPTGHMLLAIPGRERLVKMLRYMLDEEEFLAPHGIRSLSKVHAHDPYKVEVQGETYRVDYVPGESNSGLFGGNSNWRGPIWFPVNYLLVEALESYHHFYGDSLKVECPTGSGVWMNLKEVASELARRLSTLFLPGPDGARPCHGDEARYADDPAWKDLVLFYEYFDADTGRGVGASHQTGWTSLVCRLLMKNRT
jgi:hypothetical protein